MAIFAIGDIQGCFNELRELLDRIRFDPAEDRIWFAGDLVNRGPDSLKALRFVRGLGEQAISVLGNHDLHLLAAAEGIREPTQSLLPVLNSADREELLEWLRERPLMHCEPDLGFALVHAGLAPQWSLDQALNLAREVEAALRGPHYRAFLETMYGDLPDLWQQTLQGNERLRFITNCLTRLRYVTKDGRIDFTHSGKPGTQPKNLVPWFQYPGRKSAQEHILFGHWSTVGLINGYNVYALDTGCVWGGKLTALRLDADGGWFSIDCRGHQQPVEKIAGTTGTVG